MKRVAPNLYKRKQPNGRGGIWVFRFQLDGRPRAMSLGPVAIVPAAKAKRLALTYRAALHEGRNPLDERKAKARKRPPTFDEIAAEYVTRMATGWKPGGRSEEQWRSSLKQYASPIIGRRPVDKITTRDILECIRPIWETRNETARRVLRRISKVITYAAAKAEDSGWTKPAPVNREALMHQLAEIKRNPVNFAALPYEEMPKVFSAVRERGGVEAAALMFCLLTISRVSETAGCEWSEIDMQERVWRLPASRNKQGRDFVQPLSGEAVRLLEGLTRSGPLVFPGLRRDAMTELLQDVAGAKVTLHGSARAGFRTWASEVEGAQPEISESILAHSADSLTRTYQRGPLLDKRRALLERWAVHCCGAPKGTIGIPRPRVNLRIGKRNIKFS